MALRTLASAALLFGTTALAKTSLEGCTYIDGVFTPSHGPAWATRTWYVPDTGEICAFLDCGGGRAPPKTDVPGCNAYEGTETYSPLFLDLASITGGGGGDEVVQTSTDEVVEATTTSSSAEEEQTTLPSTVTTSEPEETGADTSAEESGPSTTSASETTSHTGHTTVQTGTSTSTGDETSSTPSNTPAPGDGDDNEGAASAPVAALLGSTIAAGVAVWFAML